MIMPTIRASIDRGDARRLVRLLGREDSELGLAAQARLEERGIDSLLDDPRVLNALLTDVNSGLSPEVICYALVRQALLEGGIDDTETADYIATLLMRFGCGSRAYRVSDESGEEFHYLVDMVTRMAERDGGAGRDAFLLHSHLGNYSLWISGLFPHFLEARVERRGAPPLSYYERMGAGGYRAAAETPQADSLGVGGILRRVAGDFTGVRRALNRISDRYFWPDAGNPVNRLLREVADRYPPRPRGA